MCMTVEDFLSRRTRQLLLEAKVAIENAPIVARILAIELNKDETWINQQINDFTKLANNYIPSSNMHATRQALKIKL